MATYQSINEIMDLTLPELRKLNATELRAMLTKLDSAANKRIKRLQSSGMVSMALQSRAETVGKTGDVRFTNPKGLTKSQLISRIGRVSGFMKLRTSTVSGTREIQESISQKITGNKKGFAELSEKKQNQFWKMYRKLESKNRAASNAIGSPVVQRMLYKAMTSGMSAKKAFESVYAQMEKEYRRMTRIAESAIDDDFYEI